MTNKQEKIYLSYKVRITALISQFKVNKPTIVEMNREYRKLFAEFWVEKLPNYIKEGLDIYYLTKREELIKRYTILLTIGVDGRKKMINSNNLTEDEKQKSFYYWLSESEKVDENGTILITLTPTDKVFHNFSIKVQ